MTISAISFRGNWDDYPDIEPWVNEPYERRRKEMEALRAKHVVAEPAKPAATKPSSRKTQGKFEAESGDVFVSSRGQRAQKKTPAEVIGTGAAILALLAAVCAGVLTISSGKEQEDPVDTDPSASQVEVYKEEDGEDEEDGFVIIDDADKKKEEDEYHLSNSATYYSASPSPTPEIKEEPKEEIIEDTASDAAKEHIDEEYKGTGQAFLDRLSIFGGEAPKNLDKLCDALKMSETEVGEYLTQLCQSDDWAGGCIKPTLFYAQISRESSFDPNVIGDGGLALGLGQFHTCAVDEVNKQFGTSYTYEDRKDPYKALEMMALLLKHCHDVTKTTYGALAMYNQGHPALNEPAGRTYVENVLAQLGLKM